MESNNGGRVHIRVHGGHGNKGRQKKNAAEVEQTRTFDLGRVLMHTKPKFLPQGREGLHIDEMAMATKDKKNTRSGGMTEVSNSRERVSFLSSSNFCHKLL